MRYIHVIAFCALGIIWGSNFIYMKLSAELISPIQVVFYFVLAVIFLKDEKISKFAFIGVIVGFIGVILISGVLLVKEDIKFIDYIATIFIFAGVFLINKKNVVAQES